MRHFRMRLILALIVGITLLSVASTYFEVLARKHVLRSELERRTGWLGTSLQPYMEEALSTGSTPQITAVSQELRRHEESIGLAIYDTKGNLLVFDGSAALIKALPPGPVHQAIKTGANSSQFGRTGDQYWLQEAIPLHVNGQQAGALVVLEDAGYI